MSEQSFFYEGKDELAVSKGGRLSTRIELSGARMPYKPFFVYILHCSDGTYYTGHTDDLEPRMVEHESGKYEGYTKSRRPIKLVWSLDFGSRIEALEAERQIKGWTRAKKEALMEGKFDLIRELAKKKDWVGYKSRNA